MGWASCWNGRGPSRDRLSQDGYSGSLAQIVGRMLLSQRVQLRINPPRVVAVDVHAADFPVCDGEFIVDVVVSPSWSQCPDAPIVEGITVLQKHGFDLSCDRDRSVFVDCHVRVRSVHRLPVANASLFHHAFIVGYALHAFSYSSSHG